MHIRFKKLKYLIIIQNKIINKRYNKNLFFNIILL